MKKAIFVVCMALCCVAIRGNAADTVSYGPVKAGETLYRIALNHKLPDVSVSQMMTLIFEANPQAFDQNDINRLMAGSTLEIPLSQAAATESAATGAVAPTQAESSATGAATSTATEASQATQVQPVEEIQQATTATEIQAAQQTVLPEPKPPKRKKKQESKSAPFRFSYEVALIDDDNIRLAQNDEDIRSDIILSGTLKAKGGKSLDSFTILNYGGSITYNKFDTFDTLDNFEFEVNTRYRFALSSGFTAPIYTLGAKIGGREFDTEMRDATFLNLTADMNKWLTNTINMTTGVGFNTQESKSDVFDTTDARIFINFDTNFSNRDLVYTTFSYITGDTVSSATPSLGIINVADAIEPDDAFGGVEANQFAYRLEADTMVFTLGYNRILTRDVSMDLSWRYVDSVAKDDDDIYYDRTILRASLLGRF